MCVWCWCCCCCSGDSRMRADASVCTEARKGGYCTDCSGRASERATVLCLRLADTIGLAAKERLKHQQQRSRTWGEWRGRLRSRGGRASQLVVSSVAGLCHNHSRSRIIHPSIQKDKFGKCSAREAVGHWLQSPGLESGHVAGWRGQHWLVSPPQPRKVTILLAAPHLAHDEKNVRQPRRLMQIAMHNEGNMTFFSTGSPMFTSVQTNCCIAYRFAHYFIANKESKMLFICFNTSNIEGI